MSVTTRNFILVLLLLLIVFRNQAHAQVSTSPSAVPGAILQYNTQPWSLPGEQKPGMTQPPANEIPEREPEKPVDPVQIEDSQTPMKPDDQLEVLIQAIRVDGNSLLPPSQIEKIIAPYQNRTLRFSDMEAVAEKITALYIKAGYINSQAYIPVQDFANHSLRIRIIETKINEILYEPARWFPPRSVLPRIAAKPGEPLNIKPLARSIRLINENPDLTLQARLIKGKVPETTDILLQGQSRFPVHMTPFMDNLGRSSIGNLRLGITGNHNNLLGFGDTNTSVVSFTKRSFGVVNQYTFPIGPYGTRLGMNFAYSNVTLGGSLKPLDIHSRSQIFTPLLMQTIWKNDRAGLNATLGFDFKNLNTDLLNEPFHRDRLRVLRPSLDGYVNDRWGRTYLNQEVGIGLNILGGSTGNTALASKAGSGTRFLTLSGGVTRVQKLPFGTTGVLRGRYQYSPDRLISAEQFQVGGAYTVRGYVEGRQLGDSGYVFNAEWYVPTFFFPKRLKVTFLHQPVREALHLVAFSDFAQSMTNRPVSGEVRRSTLLSCGIGLRLQINRLLVGRLDAGFPLWRQDNEELRPRLHFGLQSTLF